MKVCDIHGVPLATNLASAEILLRSLSQAMWWAAALPSPCSRAPEARRDRGLSNRVSGLPRRRHRPRHRPRTTRRRRPGLDVAGRLVRREGVEGLAAVGDLDLPVVALGGAEQRLVDPRTGRGRVVDQRRPRGGAVVVARARPVGVGLEQVEGHAVGIDEDRAEVGLREPHRAGFLGGALVGRGARLGRSVAPAAASPPSSPHAASSNVSPSPIATERLLDPHRGVSLRSVVRRASEGIRAIAESGSPPS